MTDPPKKIYASQVNLVLQRAAEIDAQGESVSVEELSRIAAEAGIDPAATEEAIAEIFAEPRSAPLPAGPAPRDAPPAKPGPPSAWRILVGGAVGVMVGLVTLVSQASDSVMPVLAVVAAMLYVGLRAAQAMKRGRPLDFQLQNFALWLMAHLTAASSTGDSGGYSVEALFATMLSLWVATSVLGGLLVHFGPRSPGHAEESGR